MLRLTCKACPRARALEHLMRMFYECDDGDEDDDAMILKPERTLSCERQPRKCTDVEQSTRDHMRIQQQQHVSAIPRGAPGTSYWTASGGW